MNKAQNGSPFTEFENWLMLNDLTEEFFSEDEDVDLEIVRQYSLEIEGERETLRLEL